MNNFENKNILMHKTMNKIGLSLIAMSFVGVSCTTAVNVKNKILIPLQLDEIQVGGWMKNQIERDITSGYISVYEELQPSMRKNAFGPVKAPNYMKNTKGEWENRRETWCRANMKVIWLKLQFVVLFLQVMKNG